MVDPMSRLLLTVANAMAKSGIDGQKLMVVVKKPMMDDHPTVRN